MPLSVTDFGKCDVGTRVNGLLLYLLKNTPENDCAAESTVRFTCVLSDALGGKDRTVVANDDHDFQVGEFISILSRPVSRPVECSSFWLKAFSPISSAHTSIFILVVLFARAWWEGGRDETAAQSK